MELGIFQYTSEEEERILGGIEGEAFFLKTPSTTELKRKYESDVKRLVNLQLHMMTLGQYYKENKIPRGLRSGIRPNLFQDQDNGMEGQVSARGEEVNATTGTKRKPEKNRSQPQRQATSKKKDQNL
ncbi:unnamed protein product [Ranitomeya imitator]|uniref:Uncharacterized protein n=1 Tax=Ranitomeya imitator TaxID=111125 RepID=A0ABN9LRV0_9NEOB|nr:unnamed protein product [Ranitomeya imitator]